MIDVNKAYKFLQFLSNKNQSGFLTPNDFNLIINRALQSWVMDRYHNVKKQNPNGESFMGWQQSQKITDDLRYLIEHDRITQVDDNGRIALPSDYLHLSSLRYQYTYFDEGGTLAIEEQSVDILRDNEIGGMLSSKIFGKKIRQGKTIVAAIYDEYIQVHPKERGRAILTYLRKPVEAVWSFTNVNNRPVYDATTSVDIEAPEEAFNEICMIACSFLGINLREGDLINYSETQKQQGI